MGLGLLATCAVLLSNPHPVGDPIRGLERFKKGDITTHEICSVEQGTIYSPVGQLSVPPGRLSRRRILLQGVSLKQVEAALRANMRVADGWKFKNYGSLELIGARLPSKTGGNREIVSAAMDSVALHNRHLHLRDPSKLTDVDILVWDIKWLGPIK